MRHIIVRRRRRHHRLLLLPLPLPLTRELHIPLARPLLPLPPPLRRHNSHALLLPVAQHPPRLPPLVIGRVRHVQHVAVAERQPPRRQPIVAHRIVVEQRAHVQRALLRRPQQRAGAGRDGRLLLQLVNVRLEAIVLFGPVLGDQLHAAAGRLERLRGVLVARLAQGGAVDAQQLVAALQLAAEVGGAAGQDEGDEDALAVLAADDVEAEAAGGALADGDGASVAGVVKKKSDETT